MSLQLNGDTGVTFNDASLQGAAASPYVLKNRIINGDFRIDQRNAGASVTITSTVADTYTLDRWFAYGSQASKFSIQQNAGSVTPPTGYTNYLGVTSLAATTVGASDEFEVGTRIEGYNISDLGWGASGASTVTLSFWVRSSLTGTFGGSLRNSAGNRSYPFSYTISSANTWEQKTVTITGDTTGTWLTTNGLGLRVTFSLGVGSTLRSTAGSWSANNYISVTGETQVVGTNGATFYITGVQLEVGSTATPFERRLYGQEFINCCRYYWQQISNDSSIYRPIAVGSYIQSAYVEWVAQFPVQMRTSPSLVSPTVTNGYEIYRASAADSFNVVLLGAANTNTAFLYNNTQVSGTGGQAGSIYCPSTFASSIAFSAEL